VAGGNFKDVGPGPQSFDASFGLDRDRVLNCRNCGQTVELVLVDLASAPPSNSLLTEADLGSTEIWFPLRVLVCEACWLVQTEDVVDASVLFSADYAYFSGISSTWVEHCHRFADQSIKEFGLGCSSHVVEIASNDGTLLKCFHDRGIRSTGIEPTTRAAAIARNSGLETIEAFLTPESADVLIATGIEADLLVANNVLAHVPDIVGFATSCRRLLAVDGVASFEFHYLVELVSQTEFDTIYHEHFSYLSLAAVEAVFDSAGLAVFKVERLSTHGGSLRVYAQKSDCHRFPVVEAVKRLRSEEIELGLKSRSFYLGFQQRADQIRDRLLDFLVNANQSGRRVVGYGAAAKGNTLLNYAGVGTDLIPYVVDNNPSKQGCYLPGSRIPIVDDRHLVEDRPDFVLVLPWNLRDEITQRLESLEGWSGSIVTAVPQLAIE
jgi:SAM-dependent methyltransferase